MNKTIEKPLISEEFASYCDHLFCLLEESIITDEFERELSLIVASDLVVKMLREVKEEQKKVLLVGNGGSAAIVAHMNNDLSKCNQMRSMVFTEQSLLTALTNDEGYASAYGRQISLMGDSSDILIAVSSSGESENIIHSVQMARKKKMKVFTLSGFSPSNVLRKLGDMNFYVPSSSYGMVELSHSIFCHYLTDRLAMEIEVVSLS